MPLNLPTLEKVLYYLPWNCYISLQVMAEVTVLVQLRDLN